MKGKYLKVMVNKYLHQYQQNENGQLHISPQTIELKKTTTYDVRNLDPY